MNRCKRAIMISGIITLFCTLQACSPSDHNQHQPQRHSDTAILTASLSQDGKLALIAPLGQPATLWNVTTNSRMYHWKNSKDTSAGIIATNFSPDGKYAGTAENFNVALWDVKTGNVLYYWLVKNKISSIAVSSEGHYILVGFENGPSEYVEMVNGLSIRSFKQNDAVTTVALSNDGRYAITGSKDKSAVLWNVQTGQMLQTWTHDHSVSLVAISPENRYALTAAEDEKPILWQTSDGKKIRNLDIQKSSVTAVAFSPDEKFIAIASLDAKITLWDLSSGALKQTWTIANDIAQASPQTIIKALAFNPEENALVSEDSNGINIQWEIKAHS